DEVALEELEALAISKGINVSGEGGEYETLVLDSPMHTSALVPQDLRKEFHRDSGRLRIGRLVLSPKK
ncbi:MAG: ATPase, partial [Methanomassiliicoccales archaeon]|nr:ATPase [Methanomassiliicoccales archaeon]